MIQITDLKMLKERIEKVDVLQAKIKKVKDDMAMILKPYLIDKEKLEDEIADLKLAIGEAAISEFEKTGVKKQLGGVGVQEAKTKTITYDKDLAFKWAKEKDMFLLLDQKAFDKAVDSLNLDFVTIKTGTENKATFPKEIKLED